MCSERFCGFGAGFEMCGLEETVASRLQNTVTKSGYDDARGLMLTFDCRVIRG